VAAAVEAAVTAADAEMADAGADGGAQQRRGGGADDPMQE
jgi:hypothetical protein